PEIPPAKALSPWFEKCRLGDSGWNAPSIDDLNGDTEREFDQTGVRNTTEEDLVRLEPETGVGPEVARLDGARLQELGIRRMMVVDARGDREPEERRE
ncbi:MAG: hypothetical protein OXF74_05610, partial [Rhodobacteraceae bacterium]|nr:hypothetical protein [Paracoccaceae bacterium]